MGWLRRATVNPQAPFMSFDLIVRAANMWRTNWIFREECRAQPSEAKVTERPLPFARSINCGRMDAVEAQAHSKSGAAVILGHLSANATPASSPTAHARR